MAGKIEFECLRCAECCRILHVKTDLGTGKWVTVGLFLLPHERSLFLASQIRPLYGAGLKGKSRPRPEVIFAYQIVQNTCPHLTDENLCAIYPRRPIACRAFPLGVIMDRKCTWVKQRFQEGEFMLRSDIELDDLPKCHNMILKYISSYKEKYPYMCTWIWDLSSQKWVRTKW